MRTKPNLPLIAIALTSLIISSAHDMFLKLNSYFVQPATETTIQLYNGTFDKSENAIARNRMRDVSVINPGEKVAHPSVDQWSEENNQTLLRLKTGREGTAVVGVSTNSSMIELTAKEFEEYLKHDGLIDMLEARKKSGEDSKPAKEKYSKHVKALIQVGAKPSDNFKTPLNYPVEFIPLANPYGLKVGDALQVQLIKDGKPLVNELVYASFGGHHSHGDDGGHVEAVKTRTDGKGMVTITLSKPGHWYLRCINMVKSTEPGVDYESNWATISFEIK
jgi:uncharacterized GH25 family protein